MVLTGYLLSSLIAVGIVFIGSRFLWDPAAASRGFGIPSGTRGAPRKNAFWPVSRIRLKTGIYLPAEDVPSGLCAPNCTRRAGL